jgi:two-component system phosphate regulon sensor histidine kinase PhoR
VEFAKLTEVDDHSGRPEIVQALATGFGKSRRRSATIDRDLVYLAQPIGSLQNPSGILRVAVPVSEIEDSLSQIHRLMWLSGGLALGLVLFIGFFVSKSMTQSLNEMVDFAKRLARGDFSGTIKPKENDELSDLGLALNKMSEDLQAFVKQITRERDQLHAILNGMVEGVMVTDRNSRIVLINDSFREIFQVAEPIIDKSTSDVFRESQLIEALDRVMTRKEDIVETIEVLSPYRKYLEAHIAILGSKDKPRGRLVVFHDITRLKHLENVRRDFVANVSHEIRTPVTAIKGYVETIMENGSLDKERARSFLETILRNTDRMAKLVDDLLHLSKLESIETSESLLEEISLSNVVNRVAESFEKLRQERQVQIKVNLPSHLPKIKATMSEVETVLENLIENAIKYGSDGGEISVSAQELEDAIEVTVADRGMGIPSDDQPRIFERFYRVDKARSRVLGGTGLGLSIVKHIIQQYGGRVWVESDVGKGSKFHFTLPKI